MKRSKREILCGFFKEVEAMSVRKGEEQAEPPRLRANSRSC